MEAVARSKPGRKIYPDVCELFSSSDQPLDIGDPVKIRRSSAISTAVVCFASLGLGGIGPAPDHWLTGNLQTATDSGQDSRVLSKDASLRVVTFNAKFLPLVFTSTTRRAQDLAHRILAGDYDVVGLNEVFAERARDILVTHLSTTFPYIVKRVGGSRRRQDSGLMLFSRFPFVPTSIRLDGAAVRAAEPLRDETMSGSILFHQYSDCTWTDCLAAKGVAHVRLRVEEADVDLFFTHLQATYTHHNRRKQRHFRDVRAVQLRELALFAGQIMSSDPNRRATTILLGDLNVPGRPAGEDGRSPRVESTSEWDYMMQTLGQSTDGLLHDAWYEHGSAGDPGLTYPASQPRARFDYILTAAPHRGPAFCIQEVAVDSLLATQDLSPTDDGYLSDHFGVRADFTLGTDTCAGEVS